MKIVLLADNDRDFVEARTEFLKIAGYTVLTAYSPEEARYVLENQRVHLGILDIRLLDDSEGDISGLDLAQDPTYRSLPKIMLTGFPSVEDVKVALRHAPDESSPAVDFLSKRDGPEAMVRAVEQAFAQHVRLNWDLEIHSDPQQRLSLLHLTELLSPDLHNQVLVQRAAELEDMLRELFYEYHHIRLDHLFWHDTGRFCISVLAQSPREATDARLLLCSERNRFYQEMERLQELAPTATRGLRLAKTAETIRFGAAAYALPDVNLETVRSLRDLFRVGKERYLRIALDHLLKETLLAWHQRGQRVEVQELMAIFRQWAGLGEKGPPRTEVERRVEALLQASRSLSAIEIQRRNGSIVFCFPNELPLICPDPVARIYTPFAEAASPVVCRISPGCVTADNILVDSDQGVWLTDFASAGQAPQWWDFICLEAILRFDLSQAPDLLAWQEFEECLLQPVRLHDDLRRDVVADLRMSVALVEQVRRQAGGETSPEVLPYYAGLLVWAVAAMAQYDPGTLYTQAERQRGAHLLLGASLITRRIDELAREREQTSASLTTAEDPSSSHALRLEEDGVQVWIGPERTVALTGQELELFLCLHEQAGKVVARKTLVERVYKEPYRQGNAYQESNLNSLVRRLREKIEPNPNRPRYILTVRGQGYRLETGDTTSS
jgi:DNA-binding response OmpR family regulator